MNGRPRLERVRIDAFSGVLHQELAFEELEYTVSIDELDASETTLTVDGAKKDVLEVRVGLQFELTPRQPVDEDEDVAVELSATVSVLYSKAPDADVWRELATRRAVADAWPRFAMWLDQQLALFGLPPADLSPRPPGDLLEEAEQAWDAREAE